MKKKRKTPQALLPLSLNSLNSLNSFYSFYSFYLSSELINAAPFSYSLFHTKLGKLQKGLKQTCCSNIFPFLTSNNKFKCTWIFKLQPISWLGTTPTAAFLFWKFPFSKLVRVTNRIVSFALIIQVFLLNYSVIAHDCSFNMNFFPNSTLAPHILS